MDRPTPTVKKTPSGAQKRKIQREREEENKKLQAQAAKYFKTPHEASISCEIPVPDKDFSTALNTDNGTECSFGQVASTNDDVDVDLQSNTMIPPMQTISETQVDAEQGEIHRNETQPEPSKSVSKFEISDPATWPQEMQLATRKDIAKSMLNTPFDQEKLPQKSKEFLQKYGIGKNHNGEPFTRDWIRISKTTDSVYCLPCCLFGATQLNKSPWCNYGAHGIGFADFHNSLRGVKLHEESEAHFTNVRAWKLFCKNLDNEKSIVGAYSKLDEENASHWRQVLSAILDAILFLAQNNLAFQGHDHSITDPNCGNFLNLIKLLSKYHVPLAEHVARLKKSQTSYLSPKIQNEFIILCGQEVRNTILCDVRRRKYFSILFDSTPDSSRMDQLSQIVRSVKCSKYGCEIQENFIDFIATTEKTGEGLTEVILQKLEKDGLELSNCRGQGYDNGSNMAGIYKGVQKRILEKNATATFLPCAAHSLNLIGSNIAEKILPGKLILGKIHNVYTFFSSSTSRWEVLRRKLKCNLKGHCDTRWSSKANAVNALQTQFSEVVECLEEISSSEKFRADVSSAAESHLRDIMTFKFVLGLAIWNEILQQINICNVKLQEDQIDIGVAEKMLGVLCRWIDEFQKFGFAQCLNKASQLAESNGIENDSGFSNVRRGRGIHPKFNDPAEVSRSKTEDNLSRFQREFFDEMMCKLQQEMATRFVKLKETREDFHFLYGKGLSLDSLEKEKHVKDLSAKYPDDFDTFAFVTETKTFHYALNEFSTPGVKLDDLRAIDVLNIIHSNGLETTYRNSEIALRIFLSLPVSVASNERSFSKLKLIKNYLRSSMGQERLSGLAILSIERELTKKIDFDTIINTFVNLKRRRVNEM